MNCRCRKELLDINACHLQALANKAIFLFIKFRNKWIFLFYTSDIEKREIEYMTSGVYDYPFLVKFFLLKKTKKEVIKLVRVPCPLERNSILHDERKMNT